jgi:hypothetical protein
MNRFHLLCPVTIFVAACAGGAVRSHDQEASLAEAGRRLAASDPDAALTITDRLLKESPDWREARIVAADASLALSKVDRPGLRKDLVLEDAVRNYELALPAGTVDAQAWQRLGEARYELGRFEGARDAAAEAVNQLTAAKAKPEQLAAPLAVAARSELQLLVAARKLEIETGEKDRDGIVRPGKDTTELASHVLARVGALKPVRPGEAHQLAAMVYQWLGEEKAALDELERGIRNAPDAAELHLAYQDRHREMGQLRALGGAYGRFVRESPGTPILLWFQGRAQVIIADDLRQKGSFQGAIDAYRKALDCYSQYKAMSPLHADTAGQWLAICELSVARCCADSGDLVAAQDHLFRADEASPLAVEYDGLTPRLVDSFGSHYAGVVFAIHRALSQGGADALEKTLAFNEAVLARHPEKWGFVYNNAALPARDLGVQIVRTAGADPEARKAAETRAMELWERSYRYYEIAARLSPDDARIVNDCGLMLIYHLNRDFDRARQLFDQAIAVGQPQLDALPAGTDADTRNLLEEAVGDAWQNIAVLMARHLHRPFAEYRQFCEKAVKYYPYQQRAARHMLDNEGREPPDNAAVPRSLRQQDRQAGGQPKTPGGGGPAAGEPPQGGAAETMAKARAAADKKVAEGDLDGALQALDAFSKELKGHAPFQALRGEINLQYARQKIAEGRSGADFLLADAVQALRKAVEIDSEPLAPRLVLAQALYEQGDFAAALKTASALMLHAQSVGTARPEDYDAIHRVRAQAAAQAYVAAKTAGGDDKELLADARTSFRALETRKKLDAALRTLWANTELHAGAVPEAVAVHTRALAANADDQALLAAVVDTAASQNQSALAVEALKDRKDPAGLWYLGRAHYVAACELRATNKNKEALADLDAAQACFEKSMAGNAEFKDSCQQYLAMCLGKKGNVAFQDKDVAKAEQWLLAAVRLRPDQLHTDLGLGETIHRGILLVADHHYQARNLAKVEAIYRAASDAADGDLDLLNNSGLFARDHGNELESAGKQKESLAMYEQSYKAYSRAQQLDQANIRLRNDRALILVWHLEREWDTARELLESAVADGQKKLAENPPVEPQAKQDLDEAVGDCFENLALLHLKHTKDLAAARKAAEASLQHWPKQRRPGARRHLQAIEAAEQKGK